VKIAPLRPTVEDLQRKLKVAEGDRDAMRKDVLRLLQENASLRNRVAVLRAGRKP